MTGEPITGFDSIYEPIRVVPPKKRGSGRVWYKMNNRSFGAFMRSDQMRDVTVDVAEDIVPYAVALTPRSDGPGPHVADDFKVKREAGLIRVAGNIRVRVDIENNNDAAAVNEFGGPNNRRVRMLARAASEFGDFKPEGG